MLTFPGSSSKSRDEARARRLELNVRALFLDEDAFGAALYVGALKYMSPEELAEYDARTVRLELQRHLGIKKLPEENFGQLMAMHAVVSTDLFYRSLPAFIEICNVLSGSPPMLGWFDPADPYEMAWALAETDLIDEREGSDVAFSEEIRTYMGLMLRETGFISPPAMLSMAIMPITSTPAELTQDADLLPAIIEGDRGRHAEIDEMLMDNTRKLLAQLGPVLSAPSK